MRDYEGGEQVVNDLTLMFENGKHAQTLTADKTSHIMKYYIFSILYISLHNLHDIHRHKTF